MIFNAILILCKLARTETPTQQQQQTAAPSISPTFDNQLIQQPVTSIDPVHQPYEHLFQQILPTVLSPPVDSRTLPSPHVLLDLCLMKAATLHNGAAKTDEVSMLRGQVALLHGQLLFERHRREAHALRNRRLAGKCREMQTLEEKNNSMVQNIYTFITCVLETKDSLCKAIQFANLLNFYISKFFK